MRRVVRRTEAAIKTQPDSLSEATPPGEPVAEADVENISHIEPNPHYLDDITGLTNRIEAVIGEHFGNELPVIHFTNAEVGNQIDKLVSTGFLEKFSDEGSIKKFHVGAFRTQDEPKGPFRDMTLENDSLPTALDKLRKITQQFYHHGLRTNKNQLKNTRNAAFSLPAAIVMEKPEKLDRGTDNYDHWVVRDSQGKEKILAMVTFDPRRATNWVTLKRSEENAVLKKMIHGIGMQRLEKISQTYASEEDVHKRADLALYAHDLVDAYLVGRQDFDSLFENIPDTARKAIEERREKYALFQQNQESPDESL